MNSPPQCVIHCRVSTGKQAYEGESLEVQKSICLDIAARNGWTVAHAPWLEAYSGRKSARPVFTEVLEFLDAHPGQVRYYVFRAIDRFTRGGTGAYERMKDQLAKRGVELVDSMGVIQPVRNTLEHVGFEYEWSRVSPSEVAEAVLATTAKAEATTILTRLIGQEIRLTQKGYKIRGPQDGYRNERIYVDGKRRVIQVPDPQRAPFYVAMFKMRAEGQLSDIQIVERINSMGFRTRFHNRWDKYHQRVIGRTGGVPLTVKRYQEIIKRPIYCGVLLEKWTNWQPVKAAYDGLVSISDWNAANRGKRYLEVEDGGLKLLLNRRVTTKASKTNPAFPFKGVVLCPTCRKPFMGSASRSRNGQRFPAYHCARNHARVARSKVAFEEIIWRHVLRLRFAPAVVSEAIRMLHCRFDDRGAELEAMAAAAAQSVRGLEARKADVMSAFVNTTSNSMRRALDVEMEQLDRQIEQTKRDGEGLHLSERVFDDYLASIAELMEHPLLLLENAASTQVQRSRFDLAFEELPTLLELQDGTAKLSLIMQLCEGEANPKSVLVRLSSLDWNQILDEVRRWQKSKNQHDDML